MTPLPPHFRVFHAPRLAAQVCTPELVPAMLRAYGDGESVGGDHAVEAVRALLEAAVAEHLTGAFATLARVNGARHREALKAFLQACIDQRRALEAERVDRRGLRQVLAVLSEPGAFPDRPAGGAWAAVAQDVAELVQALQASRSSSAEGADILAPLHDATRLRRLPPASREAAVALLGELEMWISNLVLTGSDACFGYEPALALSRRRLVWTALVGLKTLTGSYPTATYHPHAAGTTAYLTPTVAGLQVLFGRIAQEAQRGGEATRTILDERAIRPSAATLREDVRTYLAADRHPPDSPSI